MAERRDHEQRMADGWMRWRQGAEHPWEQSERNFGPFWLRISKRDVYEDMWEIDLYKLTAYTQFRSAGISGVEVHALRWAYPHIRKAYSDIRIALRDSMLIEETVPKAG